MFGFKRFVYFTFTLNVLEHLGHLTVCFPLLRGKRSVAEQWGHARNICAAVSIADRRRFFDLNRFLSFDF